MNRRSVIASLALLSGGTASASWLSEITGVHIDITNPTKPELSITAPKLEAIPKMLENLPKDATQFLLNPTGTGLSVLIRNASKQAASVSQPLPDDVRRLLAPYFPPEILNKARWALYDSSRISLDSAIHYWFMAEGAVTLDNIIVFSNRNVMTDIELWAHEMTHVLQYHKMGVESFANMYIIASGELEGQAKNYAGQVRASIQQDKIKGNTQSAALYSVSRNAMDTRLDAKTLTTSVQQYYPAQNCMSIVGNTMSNTCPVAVRITDFSYVDMFGRVLWTPCWDNLPFTTCLIRPGYFGPAFTPSGGPVVNYRFIYANF